MRYLHQDHLGSTSVITDDTGAAVYEASYDPWGNVNTSTGTADTDRLYTGQRFDSATGLYYYNARYYDPYLARFISPDTIVPGVGDPQAWNRYAYVLGNPVRYTDPSGHCVSRGENGRVQKTNFTLDCTFSEIEALASDVGALGYWLDRIRERDGSLGAYYKSDVGGKLASDLVMNEYDGLLAMMGLYSGDGCTIRSATNLDCSPLKPTPKERPVIAAITKAIQSKRSRSGPQSVVLRWGLSPPDWRLESGSESLHPRADLRLEGRWC